MTYDDYVSRLTDLMSDDPARVREANAELFHELVDQNGEEHHHGLALADVEARLDKEARAKKAKKARVSGTT